MKEVKGRERAVERVTVTVSTADGKVITLMYDQITHAEIRELFQVTERDRVPQNRCSIEFGYGSLRVEEGEEVTD